MVEEVSAIDNAISAGDWLKKVLSQRQQRAIFKASVELTERCNYQCVHCYINQPAGDKALQQRELTLAEWQHILDQMADAGVIWLLVTGGEPLLRPDFREFHLYARQKGFHITLFTNGSLLTPEMVDFLAQNPPWEIEITLYGATAETYEAVTRIPGSYQRCIEGIERLLERKLALNLKTMALTLNAHELPAMQEMAQRWGVKFRYDPNIHSRYSPNVLSCIDRENTPLNYRLSPEAIHALECADPKRLQQVQEFCDLPWPVPDPDSLFTCGAGLKTFHVDAYGGLYPCIAARWLRYDLRAGSLAAALAEFLPSVRRLELTHNHTCRECELRVMCGICPAWAYTQLGDPEAADLFRCECARLRQQLLLPTPEVENVS